MRDFYLTIEQQRALHAALEAFDEAHEALKEQPFYATAPDGAPVPLTMPLSTVKFLCELREHIGIECSIVEKPLVLL